MGRAREVTVGDRTIGHGHPAYVIAEIGVNHDGSLERALTLVDEAAHAGADAVKFQTFDPAALAVGSAPLADYQQAGTSGVSTQLEMLTALALSASDFRVLATRCSELGVDFLSTPFDEPSAELLIGLGVPALKIGSGELTNTPFLAHCGALGVPVLLSTGMATELEIDAALTAVRRSGNDAVVLLHCVSSYPTPVSEANLLAIVTLRERFGVPVGYSDHCLGLDVSLAAIALGSTVLERHITLDRELLGPDHAISLLPSELRELIDRARAIESALGDGIKAPREVEANTRQVARRSLVAARDLEPGHVVALADIAAKRPAGGLTPARRDDLVGATLTRGIRADEPFTPADVDGGATG